MTQNALQLWPEIIWITAGFVVLLVFGVAIAARPRRGALPGSRGRRKENGELDVEEIHTDGYIDSFSNDVDAGRAGLPLIVKIALPGVLLWWLLYLIVNWMQR